MADDWHAPTQRAANFVVTSTVWNEETQDNITALKSAVMGDAQATSEVIHQHKSGTFANRPAAGNVGRTYTCTDFGVTFIDDGTEWHVFSHISALCDRLFDDFHLSHGADLAATGYFGGWRIVIGGAGGSASAPVAAGKSYIGLQSLAGAGAYVNMTPKGSAEPYIQSSGAANYPITFDMGVRLNDNATVDYHFGLMDTPATARPPAPSSSIMFRVQDNGNIFTVTQDNGGGETTNDTGATPTYSSIDWFRIEVFSASSVVFTWWKGGLGGTKYTETHVAGIPSSEKLLPAYTVRSSAAAISDIRVDTNDLLYKRDY